MGLMAGGIGQAIGAERFEVVSWLDHFDFAAIPQGAGFIFDSETVEGCGKIISHVEEVGTTTILWRNCAGSTMRYQSKAESHHQDVVLDKRRVPDTRPVWGWVHYGAAEPDQVQSALDISRERGMKPGIHWPFEENHGGIWTFGRWNLEHPQFWCKSADGQVWPGRSSIAYPEVMAHKLELVQELLDRGMESLFIDTFRSGGWSPAFEYSDPVVAAWRAQYNADPPENPTDLRWCQHVAGYVTEFLRQIRAKLDASGRKVDLMVGVFGVTADGTAPLIQRGADWHTWVDEGIIDTLVINGAPWDAKDPFESTRTICRAIMDRVDGKCRVLWPVRSYDYGGYGMPSYAKATGLKQHEIAEKLMRMAWEEGAAGISLECVDYNNYNAETRKVMRELAEGDCRFVREARVEGQ